MPSRGATAAAVADGKKTLSDNEVLAYSKNRFVEHNLRHKVQQLSDQEQVCHDHHQREIGHWRHFMRQSSRTTGMWSHHLRTDTDLWPEEEEEHDSGAAEQQGEDPIPERVTPRGNPSTELARSLMFRSEALSQLQKPWVYSYSEASHNTLCKDALEVARVKEKRLLFRRAASATGTRSQTDPLSARTPSRISSPRAPSSRLLSSRGEGRQAGTRTTRPLTGRSTPGVMHKSASDSQHRQTASAVINKNRPQTSMGVVRVSHKPLKVAWTDKHQTRGNSCPQNHVHDSDEMKREGLDSPDSVHAPERVASQHVTTVFKFTDSGESVEISSSKEKSPKEVKLPTVKKRKYGVVLNTELLNDSVGGDCFHGTTQESDTVDACSKRLSEQTHKQVNQQINEQSNQQTNEVQSDCESTSQGERTDTPQTAANGSEGGKEGDNSQRLQRGLAVWKQKAVSYASNSNRTSGPKTVLSQPLVALPEGETQQTSSQQQTRESHSTNAPLSPTKPPPSPAPNQTGNLAENQDDEQQKASPNPSSTSRPSDWRPRPSGQRVSGTSDVPVSGIQAVPVTHSPVKRRGSFMKIVEQLEALRAGNHRRSVRGDDDPDPQPEDKEVADNKPDNESTANTANDTATPERAATNNVRQKFAKVTTAVAVLKKFPKRQQSLDKIDEASHVNRSVPDNLESQPTEAQPLALDEDAGKAMMEFHSEHLPLCDLDDEVFYSSNVHSLAGSDYTTFKGYKIRNYVRPQYRYRADPFLSSRREKTLIRLSIEYPIYLNGNRGDLKSQMLFPKTCRQKVLQELVHRNHQPLPVEDTGVVPPELRAKIDEFFKTIEHYCPKPQILLDQ